MSKHIFFSFFTHGSNNNVIELFFPMSITGSAHQKIKFSTPENQVKQTRKSSSAHQKIKLNTPENQVKLTRKSS